MAKVSPEGDYVWVTTAGGTGEDRGYCISALADGSSIVTGEFRGTANFGDFELTNAKTGIFVAKLNSNGVFEWAMSPESTEEISSWTFCS